MALDLPNVPDYVDEQDYQYILARYLGNVRDDVDKRDGSVVWDSGAPLCIELAIAYMYVQAMILNCFAATAGSPYLEMRCEEQGIERDPATYAKRLGVFTDGSGGPYALAIGTRFSTIDEVNLINYVVSEVYTENGVTVPGSYILTCETAGEIGNQYYGEITPLFTLTDLATATLTDVLVPGENEQDLEDLREEYFNVVNQKAFGGNITQYREFVEKLEGVGSCQVYPTWNGGGTVKISFLDSTYHRPSNILVQEVQQAVDPHYNDAYAGMGLGTAPIGHVVTIVAPSNKTVDISATVELKPGIILGQVLPLIISSIENYFDTIRQEWDMASNLNVYSSKVILAKVQNAILDVEGVVNVLNCKLNNLAADITLTENATTQEIPILGEVTINE